MEAVFIVLVAHLLLTAAYAGFQWTVQIVVYRQFTAVPAAVFTDYERSHQRRISLVVGPLFAGQVMTTIGVLSVGSPGPAWLRIASAMMVGFILAVTAFLAVPLHRRLSVRFDPAAFTALLRVDMARTIAASLSAVLACAMLLGPAVSAGG